MSAAVETLLPVLELLLNQALRLDEETLAQVENLDETGIFLEITDLNARVRVLPKQGGVHLSVVTESAAEDAASAPETGPVLQIRCEMRTLLLSVFSGDAGALPKGVSLNGDLELARKIEALIRGYEPDLEERLSAWMGDEAARLLVTGGSGFRTLLQSGSHKLLRDLHEYLVYETEILIDSASQERFIAEVDRLRDRIERLAQRLDKLALRWE